MIAITSIDADNVSHSQTFGQEMQAAIFDGLYLDIPGHKGDYKLHLAQQNKRIILQFHPQGENAATESGQPFEINLSVRQWLPILRERQYRVNAHYDAMRNDPAHVNQRDDERHEHHNSTAQHLMAAFKKEGVSIDFQNARGFIDALTPAVSAWDEAGMLSNTQKRNPQHEAIAAMGPNTARENARRGGLLSYLFGPKGGQR